MPTTPIFAFPYPALTDAPNGAAQIQALAEAVEDEINRVDSDITAVEVITNKFSTGATARSVQDTNGTTTSSTFVETLTGGTACSLAFVAPQSGMVIVHNAAFLDNSATGRTVCSWIIRNGATIGSGTTFLDGDDTKSISILGTASIDSSAGRATLVTGLTAGNSYNIRQRFKTSAGTTASYQYKELIVAAVWQ